MAEVLDGDPEEILRRHGRTTLSEGLLTHLRALNESRIRRPEAGRGTPAVRNPQDVGAAKPKRVTATAEQIMQQLLGLEVLFPSQQLDRQQQNLKYRIFYEDLRHLTAEEMAEACRRYRQNPNNKFFPTPGQILAALRGEY